MRNEEKRESLLEKIVIIICFILIFIFIIYTPVMNKYRNNGELIINEVMAKNKSTIKSIDGYYYDYIELYNGYDSDIDISGYYLSDDNFNLKKWSFPENTVIKSKEYLVVYATGEENYQGEEIHSNFKLDSSGEVITLSNKDLKSLSKIYYLETDKDTSYGYNGSKYVYYYNGTPNKENSGEYSNDGIEKKDTIIINEYGNKKIELYNSNNYDINIDGYSINNNIIKDIVISKNNYYVLEDIVIEDSIILKDSDNNIIDYVSVLDNNIYGLYNNKWYMYKEDSFGSKNLDNYIVSSISKDIIINEVLDKDTEEIELRNISNEDINLSEYSIGDKSGYIVKFPNIIIKKNSYLVIYGSSEYSYKNNKFYTWMKINNSSDIIYLYKNDLVVDTFNVGKLRTSISTGINSSGDKVFFKNTTIGKDNSNEYFLGYADAPVFSINGGYAKEGDTLSIESCTDCKIYYTIDGSFPSNKSNLYKEPIKISKNMVVKAIAYRDNYLESDVVSRTYIIDRVHDLPIVSISTSSSVINTMFQNYSSNKKYKVSFEFYESNGELGTSFTGDTRFVGMDSRQREQKSMAIYLNKDYGISEVTYPFFKDSDTLTYSSFIFRNSGEDPYKIRIQDTVLTYALKDKMDIDMQDYRAVVIYINGKYYGLYNMREKLNGDYIESNFGVEEYDLIKYAYANTGSVAGYNKLVNYIKNNDPKDSKVYEYIESQLDIQEVINYMIVESYYGNTDQGNIRYWKAKDGKWRFMLYDLDWSLWNTSLSFNYMVMNTNSPAVTNLNSLYTIGRRLYRNSEFRDLYLKSFAKYLKEIWNPNNMNSVIDELAGEIRTEMPYHIKRWPNSYSSMNNWEKNVNNFKTKLKNRYNYVVKNIKSQFNLSDAEYKKYFGDL